ncbi:N-acetyltransferase [Altererythrobacter sp. KTW20L]|uniref:GNAT family N-acetyltransferase n=1 Tax=Altererythrobacter sp. KTW20L TaxID=2942210 RepID=UPI0020BE85FA|nr:GNAT family N-acetyltransferase [Altererythrobacter sp. KTW20L]MCL6249869.1 N-acetyltransferase [Altererythrobacter sp. KTW20L]
MSDPANPPITRETTEHGGVYYAKVAGASRQAELTWQDRGGVRLVDHTFVPPEARGQGLALKLVQAIVADARSEDFRIAPVCPYVVTAFGRNPDWADVRADIPR